MESYHVKPREKIDYSNLRYVVNQAEGDILLAQWTEKVEGVGKAVPKIFVGRMLNVESSFYELSEEIISGRVTTDGIGDIKCLRGGVRSFIPLVRPDKKRSLARIIDNRRNVIYEDSGAVENWERSADYWLHAVHQGTPSVRVKNFLDKCQNFVWHRDLLSVYGLRAR
ncbi:MAG: hypothetical protein QF381_03060 [Nitrososphaerales archaeon]|jgi:hypothetical protein|nr:hypothetical protein [Nitrososphaerales archaeon]